MHLYLKSDVLLLADVFEKFRNLFLKVYGLDPCHYYSAPNISWDAMLKKTQIKLELLSDIDMLLFCEKGIRGGLNGVGEKRYLKANNKYMSDYNQQKPSVFGLFLDVVNLYGGTMMKKHPVGGFQWSDDTLNEILSAPDDNDFGYFVMVDLEYPTSLHDSHNDFPLAAEKMLIEEDMLSSYQKTLGSRPSSVRKLLETLHDKREYVCHYSVLKFYQQKGLKITKLHRALKFKQSNFMKAYIEQNTKLRQEPDATEFEKNFFKLLNNSCFGKTMENLRQRYKMVFVNNEEKAKFYTNKFNFKKFTIFREDLVGITLSNKDIRWNKPTYIGASILDVSKLELCKFHYDVIKPMYSDRARVLYRDTDSLFYEIFTDDLYKDLQQISDELDCSSYPKNHFLYSDKNKKVPLKMSDELHGEIVDEANFFKSKLYSIRKQSGVKQSAKSVNRAVKNTLHHDLFRDVLKSGSTIRKPMLSMRSKLHSVFVTEVNKIALSAFDDKRFYLADGIHSLAYGHYKIQKDEPDKIYQKSKKRKPDETREFSGEVKMTKIDKIEEFNPPDPGFWKTKDILSDDDELIDWDQPIVEKPFDTCPYIDFEAVEDNFVQ